MTPRQNAAHLQRMRAKTLDEFCKQSVGMKMLQAEMVKAAVHSAKVMAALERRAGS